MRKIHIYGITHATEMMAGDYKEFRYMNFDKMQPLSMDEVAIPINTSATVKRQPINHLRKVRGGELEEKYIVLDPELATWLEAPFKEAVEKAEAKVHSADMLAFDLGKKICRFIEFPFYKRIWLAIIGRIE